MEEAKVGKIQLMLRIENAHRSLWVSVTRRILSTADPPKQDIGCPLGDFGITFFTCSPLSEGMKTGIVLHCDNPCQFGRTRLVYVQPSPFFTGCPSFTHQYWHVSGCWKFGPLDSWEASREAIQRPVWKLKDVAKDNTQCVIWLRAHKPVFWHEVLYDPSSDRLWFRFFQI